MKNYQVNVRAQLVWEFRKTRAGAMLGVCDALALTLQAETAEELRSMIDESLHYFFLDHFEEGTLDAFLRRRGWESDQALPARHDVMPEDLLRFNVPWIVAESNAA